MKTAHKEQHDRCSAGLYRLLLRLYPRRFRHAYGAAMEQVFRELVREHGTRIWLRVLHDLPESVFSEHLERVRAGGYPMKLSAYGLVLGVVLGVAILWTNILDPSFGYFGIDEPVAMGVAVVALLAFFVASGFLAVRDTGRLLTGMQVGAITALVGMGLAMLTFAVVDNLFLDVVSKQPDKIWNFQHGHDASMRTMINAGLLRGVVLVLPVLVLVGAVCGTIGAALRRLVRTSFPAYD